MRPGLLKKTMMPLNQPMIEICCVDHFAAAYSTINGRRRLVTCCLGIQIHHSKVALTRKTGTVTVTEAWVL